MSLKYKALERVKLPELGNLASFVQYRVLTETLHHAAFGARHTKRKVVIQLYVGDDGGRIVAEADLLEVLGLSFSEEADTLQSALIELMQVKPGPEER